MSLADDLAKTEYDRLSKEIVSIQDEANQLARYAVVAAAAICVAVATKHDEVAKYLWILKWLPLAISVLFSGRVGAQFLRLQAISRYMESRFEAEVLKKEYPYLGWETHLNEKIRQSSSFRINPRGIVGVFWGVLWALSIVYIFVA